MEQVNGIDKALLNSLSKFVGISRSNCNQCLPNFPTGKISDITTSSLGLFVDEDINLKPNLMNITADCKTGGVWDRLISSRELAITDVVTDIKTLYSENLRTNVNKNLIIGLNNVNSGNLVTNDQNGTRKFEIKLNTFHGGTIHFERMAFLAKLVNPQVVPMVQINFKYKDETDWFYQCNFPVVNEFSFGSWQPYKTYIDLPDGGFTVPCDGKTIEVYYTLDTSVFRPYYNQLKCVGCQNSLRELKIYFANNELPSGMANGISLETRLFCDTEYISTAIGHKNKTAGRLIGQMIVARTIQYFIGKERTMQPQTSTQQVLKAQTDADYYSILQSGYNATYSNRLSLFSTDYELKNMTTECFTCRSGKVLSRGGIIL